MSWALPHGRAPLTALLPGAALVSAGAQVIHLVTLYYLVGRLERVEQVYGAIGSAATVLLWLFLVARLMVASATLNAVVYERSAARAG